MKCKVKTVVQFCAFACLVCAKVTALSWQIDVDLNDYGDEIHNFWYSTGMLHTPLFDVIPFSFLFLFAVCLINIYVNTCLRAISNE